MQRVRPAGSGPTAIVALGVVMLSGVACSEPAGPPPPPAGSTGAPSSEPREDLQVRVVDAIDYEDATGYRHVGGQVTNLSETALRDARVVVTWYTDWEDLVTTRDVLLDPIASGDTQAFDVAGPSIPFASKFAVEFTDAHGVPIPTDYSPRLIAERGDQLVIGTATR